MRRAAALLVLSSCWWMLGCEDEPEPRPQWLVHIGTDAPVPGFGDRVRIDLVDEEGGICLGCSRVFDVRRMEAFPLSLGVLPAAKGPPRLRARLFRAEAIDSRGEPLEPIIDVLGRLPPLPDEPLDVRVLLSMDCFGKPALVATSQSCDPQSGVETTDLQWPAGGPEALPAPGSWGPGEEPCVGDPPEGMVCVPGGVFLLGSRTFAPFGPDFDPVPEQLVHVSAYFLDTEELTVAALRPLVADGVAPPVEQGVDTPFCAYTAEPGPNEAWSVNCLDRATAAQACAAQGKRLPTEAEWEYAAGGRSIESPYPWALPSPTNLVLCAKAIVARGDLDTPNASRFCILNEPNLDPGPAAGGSRSDVTDSGLFNLGGNLSEWTADDFARYDDPSCWGTTLALHENPRCGADPTKGVLRGGSWTAIPYNTHVYFRQGASAGLRSAMIGARCARSSP